MLPVVRATEAAVVAVDRLVRTHGELIFVLSAGCCDGSAPMCFPVGDFSVGAGDIVVGTVAGCPVYVERRQLDAWPHAEIVLDVEPGYADGFSLAAGEGQHFVAASSSCRTTSSEA